MVPAARPACGAGAWRMLSSPVSFPEAPPGTGPLSWVQPALQLGVALPLQLKLPLQEGHLVLQAPNPLPGHGLRRSSRLAVPRRVSSSITYTRRHRPRGSRLVISSPEAIRRSRVDRDTASSRQASAFVGSLMVVLLVFRWIAVVPLHVITCHF